MDQRNETEKALDQIKNVPICSTPLQGAVICGQEELVNYLLSKGAKTETSYYVSESCY